MKGDPHRLALDDEEPGYKAKKEVPVEIKKKKGSTQKPMKPIKKVGFNPITDMPTSQVRVRHVFVLTADRRTDLVGRPLLHVNPTISMTLPRDEAYMLVRTQD
jgi:hypothetical protein